MLDTTARSHAQNRTLHMKTSLYLHDYDDGEDDDGGGGGGGCDAS